MLCIFSLAEKPVIITAESHNCPTGKHFQSQTRDYHDAGLPGWAILFVCLFNRHPLKGQIYIYIYKDVFI